MKLKSIISTVVCSLIVLLSFSMNSQGKAEKIHKINQVIDLNALTPENVYRFVPDYLRIKWGDSIQFLNSTGNHTVTSLEGVWPEGVEFVNIAHKPVASVIFDKPGIYGFKCKVHGRHGMYALVIVGKPDPDLEKISLKGIGARGRKVFEGLLMKMKEDMAKHKK